MLNSPSSALVIAIGKIVISLLSAFAIVYFRFRFRAFFFWMIFVTLMLPVEVRILPTFKVVSDLGMLAATRAHHSAHRVGHRDVPVPPVLPHDPRRAGRGRAHRRRRPHALLLGRDHPAVAAEHRGALRHPFIYGWNQYLVAASSRRRSRCTRR